MDTDRYAKFVQVGNFTRDHRDATFLGPMGLSGEAGEVSELFKKHLLHGKELDRVELVKELGDVAWYFFHILNTMGISFDEVLEENVTKLCNRYPTQYGSPEEWIHGTFVETVGIDPPGNGMRGVL